MLFVRRLIMVFGDILLKMKNMQMMVERCLLLRTRFLCSGKDKNTLLEIR